MLDAVKATPFKNTVVWLWLFDMLCPWSRTDQGKVMVVPSCPSSWPVVFLHLILSLSGIDCALLQVVGDNEDGPESAHFFQQVPHWLLWFHWAPWEYRQVAQAALSSKIIRHKDQWLCEVSSHPFPCTHHICIYIGTLLKSWGSGRSCISPSQRYLVGGSCSRLSWHPNKPTHCSGNKDNDARQSETKWIKSFSQALNLLNP